MAAASKEQFEKSLKQEVTDIIEDAVKALKSGQSTAYARSRLREVSRRLTELEHEYKGGCSW
jgi:hypothetical protein